jgi:hypothetical protein
VSVIEVALVKKFYPALVAFIVHAQILAGRLKCPRKNETISTSQSLSSNELRA